MANPQGTPIWYELVTADPDRAKRFYDAVAGWSVQPAPPGPMDYRMIGLPDGGNVGGMMRITPDMAAGGAKPGWLFYVGVDDVDAIAGRAGELGATVVVPPTDIPDVGRFALLADPQGSPFYIMRGASAEDSTAFRSGETATPGHAVWNELTARDPDGAIAFYTQLFGWRQEGAMPMGELGDYSFLQVGADAFGAAMRLPPGGSAGWLFYFMVPDIDAAATRVSEGGGSVIQEPIEIPGGSYSLVALDPEGVRFGLVGARKES